MKKNLILTSGIILIFAFINQLFLHNHDTHLNFDSKFFPTLLEKHPELIFELEKKNTFVNDTALPNFCRIPRAMYEHGTMRILVPNGLKTQLEIPLIGHEFVHHLYFLQAYKGLEITIPQAQEITDTLTSQAEYTQKVNQKIGLASARCKQELEAYYLDPEEFLSRSVEALMTPLDYTTEEPLPSLNQQVLKLISQIQYKGNSLFSD